MDGEYKFKKDGTSILIKLSKGNSLVGNSSEPRVKMFLLRNRCYLQSELFEFIKMLCLSD